MRLNERLYCQIVTGRIGDSLEFDVIRRQGRYSPFYSKVIELNLFNSLP